MNNNHFKLFRKTIKLLTTAIEVDPILPIIEKRLLSSLKANLEKTQPIFIIGSPRTGSTLLFELIVSFFNASYFTNLASLYFKSPTLIAFLQNKFLRRNSIFTGKSNYGYINGFNSPSEAGQIFNFWFRRLKSNTLDDDKIRYTIYAISQIMNGPFVSKNLNISLYIKQIKQIFPEAIFIQIRRDPIYTAQSIIMARRNLYGNQSIWFSVKPPNYDKIKRMEAFKQTILQIKSINDIIKQSIVDSNVKNTFEINYANLCSNPLRVLENIKSLCDTFGLQLYKNPNWSFKNLVFNRSEKQKLSNKDWNHLNSLANIFL